MNRLGAVACHENSKSKLHDSYTCTVRHSKTQNKTHQVKGTSPFYTLIILSTGPAPTRENLAKGIQARTALAALGGKRLLNLVQDSSTSHIAPCLIVYSLVMQIYNTACAVSRWPLQSEEQCAAECCQSQGPAVAHRTAC